MQYLPDSVILFLWDLAIIFAVANILTLIFNWDWQLAAIFGAVLQCRAPRTIK